MTSSLRTAAHKGAITPVPGRTSVADLPRLLKRCALCVGNGPKQVAAAVGIPTGVHSGIVDPAEWDCWLECGGVSAKHD
jgi:hypothetical protein